MAKTYISLQRFHEILHKIADRNVGKVERAFLDAMRITANDINEAELARALTERNVDAAFRAVGQLGKLEARTRARMERALRAVFAEAARASVVPLRAANIGVRFNVTYQRAVNYASKAASGLVREVSDATRGEITRLIVRGFTWERTIQTTQVDIAKVLARRVKNTLGLTRKQYSELQTVREELQQRAAIQLAVRESGRGDRWLAENVIAEQFGVTPQKVQAVMRRPPITAEQAAARADRLAARKLRVRANSIARTETITATARGNEEVWREAQARGVIKFDESLPTQYLMPDGSRIDGPAAHPGCRCSETTSVVDGVATRYWLVTPDDLACETCLAIADLNFYGVGLAAASAEERLAA